MNFAWPTRFPLNSLTALKVIQLLFSFRNYDEVNNGTFRKMSVFQKCDAITFSCILDHLIEKLTDEGHPIWSDDYLTDVSF